MTQDSSDYLGFITVFKRIEFVREILARFHFNEINLNSAKGLLTFKNNLIALKNDLITAGIEDEEIQVMIEILEGHHPTAKEFAGKDKTYSKAGGGWKIHLHVRPRNHKFVYYWLSEHCEFGWKYLHGGEEGKEFTVYVGSWDATEQFATFLMHHLGNHIENPIGDVLRTDLRVYEKIWARFDAPRSFFIEVQGHKFTFHQYGSHGLPYLNVDMEKYIHSRDQVLKSENKYIAQFLQRSYGDLNQGFGVYFRGSKNQVSKRIVWWINYLSGVPAGPQDF